MKFLIIFIYLIAVNFSYAADKPDIKNLVLSKNLKTYNDVTFKDKNQKNVNLDEFKGKLLLLNFWATWCAPCLKEIPELLELKKKYSNDLDVIFISVDANPPKVIPKFLKKNNFKNISIYLDKNLKLSEKLGVKVMPTTIIVNNSLEEISRVKGYIDWADKAILLNITSLF